MLVPLNDDHWDCTNTDDQRRVTKTGAKFMCCECFGMHLPNVTMMQTGAWLT